MRLLFRPNVHSNAAFVAFERIAASGLGALATILVARTLGAEQYGDYLFGIYLLGIALAVGHLGLDGLIVRHLIQRPEDEKKILGTAALLKLTVYVALFAIAWALPLENHFGANGAKVIRALSPTLLLIPLTSTTNNWLQAHHSFVPAAMSRIVAVMLGTTLKISFLFMGYSVGAVAVMHSGIFAIEALLLLLITIKKGGPVPWKWRFDKAMASRLVVSGLPLALATLFALSTSSSDLIGLRAQAGVTQVGQYGPIAQILQLVQIIPYAITLVIFPKLLDMLKLDEAGMAFHAARHKYVTALIIAGVATGCLVAIGGPVFVRLVFGKEFEAAAQLVRLAAFATPLLFLRALNSKLFIALDRGYQLALAEFLGLITAVACVVVLVPHYLMLGALVAVMAGYSVTLMLSYVMLRR